MRNQTQHQTWSTPILPFISAMCPVKWAVGGEATNIAIAYLTDFPSPPIGANYKLWWREGSRVGKMGDGYIEGGCDGVNSRRMQKNEASPGEPIWQKQRKNACVFHQQISSSIASWPGVRSPHSFTSPSNNGLDTLRLTLGVAYLSSSTPKPLK